MISITEKIEYIIPNFENEWIHAEKYPEFAQMGRKNWIQFAHSGKNVSYKEVKNFLPDISNQNLNFVHSNRFEIPIVVKFSNDDYQLLCIKQRLAKILNYDSNPKIWLIDISNYIFSI